MIGSEREKGRSEAIVSSIDSRHRFTERVQHQSFTQIRGPRALTLSMMMQRQKSKRWRAAAGVLPDHASRASVNESMQLFLSSFGCPRPLRQKEDGDVAGCLLMAVPWIRLFAH